MPSSNGIKKEDILIVEDTEGTKKGTVKQFDEALGVSQLKVDLSNQNKKITDLQTTTEASFNSQNSKIDNFKSEVNTSLSNQNTLINQTANNQNSRITTVENRMDTFTKLGEGSTTGDAELQDIRVGANGVTYTTAGDAVRGQYSQLKEDLGKLISYKTQFIDNSKLEDGTYWADYSTKANAGGFKSIYLQGMKKGTYHINALSANFTWFKNITNGTIKKASDLGLIDVNGGDTIINIDFDFDVKLTILSITEIPMWSNHELPTEYFYGNTIFLTDNVIDKTLSKDNLAPDSKIVGDKFKNIEKFTSILGNQRIQYINHDEIMLGKYWWGTGGTSTGDGFKAVLVKDMPKGEYHINAMSAPFTFFVNKEDGTTKKATDLGFNDIVDIEIIINIPFNFDLYLTTLNANNPMWANGELPNQYIYGVYNVNLSDSVIEQCTKDVPKKYYVGSTRQYTTLKSAVEEATKYLDSIIYLDSETFDLAEEFGSEYLENYARDWACGLFLRNRVHIIGAEGSKIIFNYTGSNSYIHMWFAPFNSAELGFTLENVRIECSNCRYCVHDERASQSDAYHNIYKRCSFTIDNSRNPNWNTKIAIGGGLGVHGDVVIEDGYFNGGGLYDISYHNSTIQNVETKSKVIVKDAYLNGTTSCANYGTSTENSQMIVNGCSLGSTPVLEKTITSDRADNMELIAWNNTIRNT